MIDTASDLFDTLALVGGALLIIWLGLGLRSSRGPRAPQWPSAAWIALLAWVAAFGFALYMILGW
jgi:hypothetical protein